MKTVELVVEERPWSPAPRKPRRGAGDIVRVHLQWDESLMRSRHVVEGARWCPGPKLWEMTWATARKLGSGDRMQGSRNHQIATAVSLGR